MRSSNLCTQTWPRDSKYVTEWRLYNYKPFPNILAQEQLPMSILMIGVFHLIKYSSSSTEVHMGLVFKLLSLSQCRFVLSKSIYTSRWRPNTDTIYSMGPRRLSRSAPGRKNLKVLQVTPICQKVLQSITRCFCQWRSRKHVFNV